MSADAVNIRLVEWDGDIIDGVVRRLEEYEGRASLSRAVSLLTGAYASMLVCGSAFPDRLIEHHANGKPYMPGLPGITVSISHSGSLAAVSVSYILHGIDIEKTRPVKERIFKRVFAREELALCSFMPERELSQYFFRTWTRKEALIKTGALTLGTMSSVSVAENELTVGGAKYYFDTITPGERDVCTLSLCCLGTCAVIRANTADRTAKLCAAAALDRLYFTDKKENSMEIERKFLIERFPDGLELSFHGFVEQSYLSTSPEVRVRRVTPSEETPGDISCKLCIKSGGGLVREEVETPITSKQFDTISAMTGREPVTKDFRVYRLDGGLFLEVSLVDKGKPSSFMYAEVEFPSVEAANAFEPPEYLGRELTDDPAARMKNYWEKGTIFS